ncbi:MAG: type II toxin-antitoxin system PemK/MazF family toxin [Gemmatimonadetes bacterium]|nr:type II toxin-antitoxin system PemK/MazF family toxin [Gemmatimonadota bacterium]
MEPSSAGEVVLVYFPFSDLSRSKLRPSVVLAHVGRGDHVLCQVTSNPYSDPSALELTDESFTSGSLHRVSYARPGKLFTAHSSLIESRVGSLRPDVLDELLDLVVTLLRPQGLTDR